MKYIFTAVFLFSLISCNTTIGVYRDVKAGVVWTSEKIKGMNSGGGGGSESGEYDGAPIY